MEEADTPDRRCVTLEAVDAPPALPPLPETDA
jgi:hypothetical protein